MASERLVRLFRTPVFRFLSSLKLAVFVLLSLSAVLGSATFIESTYGTRAVHLMVYGTWWFYGLLAFLATNVFCAAMSRYPWKRHQTGFVITHSGILTILFGSFLTMQFGVDGSLPVTEGDQDGKVLLSGLALTVLDEASGALQEYPVPEAPLRRSGSFMTVAFDTGDKLNVSEWIPRAVLQPAYVKSPSSGIGSPAIHVEIANTRFRLDEWMADAYPGKGNELNLGPAVLRFRKLWSTDEDKAFLAPVAPNRSTQDRIGHLIVDYRGKTSRVAVSSALSRWKRLGAFGLELKVESYLPYAVVDKEQLVSKSDRPVNPAVQVLLRDDKGNEEKHSIFAVYPEFSTMHKGHRKDGERFGVKIRFVSTASKSDDWQTEGRGRLEIAQASGDDKLFYRVFGKSGERNSAGEMKVGEEIATGWMDLKFKVSEWYSHALYQVRPHYVEEIQGTDNNFVSSLYVEPLAGKALASGAAPRGFWLTEGETRNLSLSGRKLAVSLTRRTLRLPFDLFLEKFTIGNDPGTTKAASYESRVKVKDGAKGAEPGALISMNEPLYHGGYTFYQASYQLREGAPPVSVFSVNFDPGRWLKYLGSIIMVLGAAVMFWMNPHYWDVLLGSRGKQS